MLAWGDSRPTMCPVALAKAVARDNLLARATDGTLYNAADETWNTDLATTRAAFVAKFAGASAQDKVAGSEVYGNAGTEAGKLRVNTGGVVPYTAKAGTYLIGDFVGPAKQTGNALENQTVEVVSTLAQAVGWVAAGNGVNPSVVYVALLSVMFPAAR